MDRKPPSPHDLETLERGRKIASAIETEVRKVVYGPELQPLIDILILALFADGHVLVQAPVGLAKTLTCAALAKTIGGVFNRLVFLPDMLPSVLSGYDVFNQETRQYEVQHGPLKDTHVFLADEINRATPKTQAALLGPMEQRHLTIGRKVFPLERVLLVLATRNPIEHDGTYDLPEAQLDRFLAQGTIPDISEETEMQILSDPDFWRPAEDRLQRIKPVTTPEEILTIREAIFANIHIEERLNLYISRLRQATWRHPLVAWGSSVRGSISLEKAVKVAAFRAGRDFAEPKEDLVKKYAIEILSHRIFLKQEARFAEKATSPAQVVREVLDEVKYD